MEIELESQSRFGKVIFAAHWKTADARFHAWLSENGNPDGIIYKNPPIGTDRHSAADFDTRRLSLYAKSNRDALAAIRAITAADLAAAVDRKAAKEVEQKEIERKEQRELDEKQIRDLAVRLGYTLTKKAVPA